MRDVIVHPRICTRHPQLREADIRTAWTNAYYEALGADSGNFPEYLWVGVDSKGRDIEMVGTPTENGWLIYHVNTPSRKEFGGKSGKDGDKRDGSI